MNRMRTGNQVTHSRWIVCLAAVTVGALLALTPVAARAGDIDGSDYAAAQVAYDEGRFGEAAVAFTDAAHAGSVRAQEILGFMYLNGANLHGDAIATDRAAARRWLSRAAGGGSDIGALLAGQLLVADMDWASFGNDRARTPPGGNVDWARVGGDEPDAVATR